MWQLWVIRRHDGQCYVAFTTADKGRAEKMLDYLMDNRPDLCFDCWLEFVQKEVRSG